MKKIMYKLWYFYFGQQAWKGKILLKIKMNNRPGSILQLCQGNPKDLGRMEKGIMYRITFLNNSQRKALPLVQCTWWKRMWVVMM